MGRWRHARASLLAATSLLALGLSGCHGAEGVSLIQSAHAAPRVAPTLEASPRELPAPTRPSRVEARGPVTLEAALGRLDEFQRERDARVGGPEHVVSSKTLEGALEHLPAPRGDEQAREPVTFGRALSMLEQMQRARNARTYARQRDVEITPVAREDVLTEARALRVERDARTGETSREIEPVSLERELEKLFTTFKVRPVRLKKHPRRPRSVRH